MAATPPDPDAEAVFEAVTRHAMQVLAAPESEREPIYEELRGAYRGAGMNDMRLTPVQADAFAWKMDEFIRTLVALIQSRGGVGGGRA